MLLHQLLDIAVPRCGGVGAEAQLKTGVCAALPCALLCTCAGGATLIFETELMDVEGDDDDYEGGL
jgi:hypothetical protein